MPIYTYSCCDQITEQYRRMADRLHGPECPECGEPMRLKIVPTMVHVPSWDRYICPVTRELVTSERQRKRIMAEHDLMDANDFKPPKPKVEAA